MQANSIHAIEVARETVLFADRQLNQLRAEHDEHLRTVRDRILTADIGSQAGIDELARLFVLDRVYPARINACEKSLSQANRVLIGATNEAISGVIAPHAADLKDAAINAAHKRLEAKIPHRSLREEHISRDDVVNRLDRLNLPVVSEAPKIPLAFAQHALDTLKELSEIETKLA